MSLQSAVQHFALAGAAIMSSRILTENADKSLNGIPTLGWISVAFAVLLPTSVTIAERMLKRRDGGNTETLIAAGAPVTAPAPPAQVAAGTDN